VDRGDHGGMEFGGKMGADILKPSVFATELSASKAPVGRKADGRF